MITDAKYRMTLAVLRDALELSHSVTLVQKDDGTPPLCFFASGTHRDVLLSTEKYGDELLRLLSSYEEKPVLLPCGAETLALVAARRAEFEAVSLLCCAKSEALERCNDKVEIRQLAEKVGIAVPDEFYKGEGESGADFAKRLPYPCVIKYVCGEKFGIPAAQRYKIIKTEADFATAYDAFFRRAGEDDSAVMVQSYAAGEGFGVSLLMLRGGNVGSFICHRRLRESEPQGGPATFCESVFLPELISKAAALLRAAEFEGPAMVEFKGGDCGYTFLEVNPRLWGTFPLTRAAGCAMTDAWIKAASGAGMPIVITKPCYAQGVKMRFLISDFLGALKYIRAGDRRGFHALLDLFKPGIKDGVFAKKDRVNKAYLRSLFERRKGDR